jgi:phosphodiesterase/alkaline phosphatase D-like protein
MFGMALNSFAQQADYRLYDEIKPKQEIVGPLVGDVTDTTARIWAYAGPGQSPLALEIAEVGSKDPSDSHQPFAAHITQEPDAKKHHEAEFFVKGLRPETKYTFVVRKIEGGEAVAPGEFTTAPSASGGARFRMAVASCFGATYVRENGHTRPDNEYVTKSWNLLMDKHPDLQLIIGDNVYANSTDYNHLWDSHVLERVNNRPCAQAHRTIPTNAVWDDHDNGPKQSDGTAHGKEH